MAYRASLMFVEIIETLLQYAATLAFYLYLRASDKYTQHPESLRSHPIMSRLLTLKQSISTFEALGGMPVAIPVSILMHNKAPRRYRTVRIAGTGYV